ncbi:MAG: Exopolysaccharide biosynthesis glycosyltransferase EpsF [Hydrogenibacillus schlegelii]|uniref:Exopolysaccharide biosynthesis glycosyltransferase EpsF n=2 Tax=Hydrogenibacillus schlegelii TaxID=1484 RepID=A0A2T5GCA5_HYDSH|nr:MAG: Exopolysaccharide biosynthesis glycosyltransferase EpsF [Hydrogenibacillus schlegelii]
MHVLELLRSFRDRAEVHLGVGEDRDGFLIEEARRLGVEVHLLKHLVHPVRPDKDLRALTEMMALLRRVRPHLIHAHSSKAGFLGRIVARALGVKSVFTAHGWAFTEGVPEGRKRLALAMERLAGRLGDRVIAVSKYDRALALRHQVVPEDRIRVIWNGVPDVSFRSSPEVSPPKMVMVARFAPPKDHTLLLRALSGLRDLPWSLDLVGDGPLLLEVRALADGLGLEGRVRFLGTRRDVAQILASAQVFVLASRWEGLPLSILEAMRAGLPVVATDVGGVREAVIDGRTGYLIPRGDQERLQERLKQLILNHELRAQMGTAGRRRYEKHFTIERMVEKTLAVYEDVVARRRKR